MGKSSSASDRQRSDSPGVKRAWLQPLGTLAKTVSATSDTRKSRNSFCKRTRKPERTPESESAARLRRFAMQSTAAAMLPKERIADCLRKPVPVSPSVNVQYVPATHSSHYQGLQVCSSVWHCPMCAAKISERRRGELARLVEKHVAAHGAVYMTTYTISHKRYDELASLLKRFLEARRKMRMGRKGQRFRRDYDVIGTVSVLEVTWSEVNGWHVHVHELVFTGHEIDTVAYEREARSAWETAATAQGLSMNTHGFQLDRTYGAVADYIAKFGREPATETPWGVESEMVKGHLKQGRMSEHFTPFALLAAIHDGREELRPYWCEYARCFKGRKQLNYSPGLKSLYDEEEKTDEEIMTETQHQAVTLVELNSDQWGRIVGNDVRGELLEVARSGRPGAVCDFLAEFGISIMPPDLTGRRVLTPMGLAKVESQSECDVLHRWRCSVTLDEAGANGARWQAFDLSELTMIIEETAVSPDGKASQPD